MSILCRINEHCRWMFGTLFTIMLLFVVGAGWSVQAGYLAANSVQAIETKLQTKEERDKYIIKTLDEIKLEQFQQRKMLQEALTKRR